MATTDVASSAADLDRMLLSLVDLVPDRDRDDALALLERLRSGRPRVLVLGEAKRGKSTLVNALIGRDVLPTGVLPVTAVTTTVVSGPREGVDVRYLDGGHSTVPLDDLAGLVTETGNPDNRCGICDVTVRVNAPVLAGEVDLVDTPGTGSVFQHNTDTAHEAMRAMDVAVLVLTADAPMSAAERDLVSAASRASVALFCVVNKADYLAEVDRDTVVSFVAATLAEVVGVPVPVVACSARTPRDPGLARLRRTLVDHLRDRGRHDLAASIAAKARALATAALDDVVLTKAAIDARVGAAQDRVRAFQRVLADGTAAVAEIGDTVDSMRRAVLRDLDAAANAASRRIRADVDAGLAGAFAGSLTAVATPGLEDRARALAAQLLRPGLEEWRSTAQDLVSSGLGRMAARLQADHSARVVAVRTSARDLLGVDLVADLPAIALPEDRRFFLTLSPDATQGELAARTVRRRMPGGWVRRRIEERVRDDAARLADEQVGRVRADLQARLTEATRRLAAELQRVHATSLTRLSDAIAEADAAARSSRGDRERTRDALQRRRDALDGLVTTLSRAAATTSGAEAPRGNADRRWPA